MKRRSAAAERVESAYVARLKDCLLDVNREEANDIVQDVREHIESAIAEIKDTEISEEQIKRILDRLGPPEKFAGDVAPSRTAPTIPLPPAAAPVPPPVRTGGNRWRWVFLGLNAAGLLVIIGLLIASMIKPTDTLQVIRTHPAPDAIPARVSEVRVEFSAQLDPETINDDALSLVPPVPGELKYDGDRTISITLETKLAHATRYRIVVSPKLRGRHQEIPLKEAIEFNTVPLKVTNISQARIERDLSSVISCVFNEPVNPQELIKHLSLTAPDGSPVRFEPVGSMPDRNVRIRIPRIPHDTITLKIAPALAGTEGPLPLGKPYERTVQVGPKLRFEWMRARYSGSRPVVVVSLNSPADVQTASPYVSIDPPVEHTVEHHYQGLRITGEFGPRRRYQITLREGLPAGAAGVLRNSVTRTVWFPDLPKKLCFAFGGGYLSPHGLLTVPINSTNVKKAKLTVQRLYESNIVQYAAQWGPNDRIALLGTNVTSKELSLEGEINTDVETLLDLRSLVGPDALGVYGLELRDPTHYWRRHQAIIIVTDLGISVRLAERKMLVWTTSISTADPVEGVRVTVYSSRRQEIGTALTDADGLAEVNLARSPEAEGPEIVVVSKGKQLSFLALSSGARARDWKLTGGRPYLKRGYEIFAFPERGVYRPGDTARLSALVRGAGWRAPEPMPMDVRVIKPNGRELLRQAIMSDAVGRMVTSVTVPVTSPTGRYRATYHLPGAKEVLGSASFLVAEYMPQTLRMKLDAPAEPLSMKEKLPVTARVEHLFGEPAEGLTAKCRVRYSGTDFKHESWKDYEFGDARVTSQSQTITLADTVVDSNGRAEFTIDHPTIRTRAAVRASIEVEVIEPGGRALVERLTRRLDPRPFYLGIKKDSASLTLEKPIAFSVAAVAPDGAVFEEAERYQATLFRVSYGSVLRRRSDGRLVYDWKRHETQEAAAEGALAHGRAAFDFLLKHPGRYRLVAESANGCTVTSDFYVSGPGARWEMADPDQLQLTLDKASYKPGETATIQIRSPFPGTALICIESDRVLERHLVRMPASAITEELTVRAEWRPNVYLTATLIRPVTAEDEWRPHRASGAIQLKVDCADRKLSVDVQSPGKVRPASPVSIAVTVKAGDQPCANAPVILAAVDEGVLALTGYRTPQPWDFFYAARGLGVLEYDMFSRLAPELAGWKLGAKPKPGGGSDLEETEMSRRLSPVLAKRVKTAVLYVGTLLTDETGVARVDVNVPEYLGELRVMVVAAHDRNFGSAQKALPVRSPIMARPSWPRFLAPGDECDVPVSVFNKTAEGDPIDIACVFEGPIEATQAIPTTVDVPANGEKTVFLKFRALGVGKVSARVTVRRGGESYSESVELAVRPAVAFARTAESIPIPGNTEQRITIGGEFLPDTVRCSLVLAGSPVVELSGALDYLLRYPYGCVEQTTSKLVPLVYLRDLAELTMPDAIGAADIDNLLQAGFARLKMMQTYNGGLAMWPNGSTPYRWGSVYAADLLVEARKAGHDVPEDLLDPLLDFIRTHAEQWAREKDDKGSPRNFGQAAYGCYVLARAGRPAHGAMASLEETLRECDRTKLQIPTTGRFHLAAANVASGEAEVAREFVANAVPTASARQSSGYLDSPARENSIMLSILLDIAPESPLIPALVQRLKGRVKLGRWGTTQENATALMALGKYARQLGREDDATVTITMPDGSTKTFDAGKGMTIDTLSPGESVVVRIDGKRKIYAFWQAEGVPRSGRAREEDAGITLRRTLYERNGLTKADYASLVQGRLYQVSLVVKANRNIGNIVLTDLLPAGLEIENPDLKGAYGNTVSRHNWMETDHVERRDDRIIVFGRARNGACEYQYTVRAVAAGTFVLPATEASCMYDPGIYSVHGRGRITVKPQ